MNETMADEELEYVGFWARVLASIVDSILWVMVSWPLWMLLAGHFDWSYLVTHSGAGFEFQDAFDTHELGRGGRLLLDWLLPALVVIVFWLHKSATPGKMLLGARVVDANTGQPLTVRQAIWRYLGYFISIFPCFLGLIWVGVNARKQGWHDMLAGSVVVRSRPRSPQFSSRR